MCFWCNLVFCSGSEGFWTFPITHSNTFLIHCGAFWVKGDFIKMRFIWLYLIMGQHVKSLPVCFDLCGDVFVLQDHALSSTLAPLCNQERTSVQLM